MIEMFPVASSNVHSVGYDAETQTLAVRFKSRGAPGRVYRYKGVPADVNDALTKAPSVGRFIAAHVKDRYDFDIEQRPTGE